MLELNQFGQHVLVLLHFPRQLNFPLGFILRVFLSLALPRAGFDPRQIFLQLGVFVIQKIHLLFVEFDGVCEGFALQAEGFHKVAVLSVWHRLRNQGMEYAVIDAVGGFVAFGGGRTSGEVFAVLFDETFGVEVAERHLGGRGAEGEFGLFAAHQRDVFARVLLMHNG